MFGFKKSSGDDCKPVNFALPVGLHNIGNTCYLNSLLQYLFTVKPIRDIVFNYDHVKLPLTDESITSRLLGGNKMQMDRGEAVVAQACKLQWKLRDGVLQRANQIISCQGTVGTFREPDGLETSRNEAIATLSERRALVDAHSATQQPQTFVGRAIHRGARSASSPSAALPSAPFQTHRRH